MNGKKNKYTCKKCRGSIITIDRESGVTPMMLRCRATAGCDGTMQSAMYRNVEGEPDFEWRQPTHRQYRKLSRDMQQHCDAGGLMIYPVRVNE